MSCSVFGSTDPGYGVLKGGLYWTPGDHASGAPADITNTTETGKVAWYEDNSATLPNSNFFSGRGTHPIGTAGNSSGEGTPLTGNANQLEIYDMSGNVMEWCFTDSGGTFRTNRGGNWDSSANIVQVGFTNSNAPSMGYDVLGFRFAKTP